TDQCDQLLFDKVVYVFCLSIIEELRLRCRSLADLFESMLDGAQFFAGQNASAMERANMRGAGLQFELNQPAIEVERSLPAFESRSGRLAEAGGPGGERRTFSGCFEFAPLVLLAMEGFAGTCRWVMARDREGSPRIRMKPAASFWS